MTKTEQLTYKQITDNSGTVRVSVPLNSLSSPNTQGEQNPEQKKRTP